jgi:ketosteroid isomerase-like protein
MIGTAMSANKETITRYFESLSRLDRPALLELLTDDVQRVEWADGFASSGVAVQGKDAFGHSISDPPGPGGLQISVDRMTEENNVVVTECIVRVPMKDGSFVVVKALNVFEMEDAKVKRVDAYTVLVNPQAK